MQRSIHTRAVANQVTVNNFTMLPNDIECEMCSNWFVLEWTRQRPQRKETRQSFDFGRRLNGENRCRKNLFCPLHKVHCSKFSVGIFFSFPLRFSFFFSFQFYYNKMWVPFLSCFIVIHVSHRTHTHCFYIAYADPSGMNCVRATENRIYWMTKHHQQQQCFIAEQFSKISMCLLISLLLFENGPDAGNFWSDLNQYDFFCYCFFLHYYLSLSLDALFSSFTFIFSCSFVSCSPCGLNGILCAFN